MKFLKRLFESKEEVKQDTVEEKAVAKICSLPIESWVRINGKDLATVSQNGVQIVIRVDTESYTNAYHEAYVLQIDGKYIDECKCHNQKEIIGNQVLFKYTEGVVRHLNREEVRREHLLYNQEQERLGRLIDDI